VAGVTCRRLLAALCSAVLLSSAASTANAQADDPLGLAWLETPDLRLVYLSPQVDYLTAHAVRTFTTALRWQRLRFGWTPTEPPVVFLKDFWDAGLANATVIPLNRMLVEVSPSANPLDTNPSSERMASVMNHETVHLANGDVADAEDRRWRGLLRGKVWAQAENPESLFYSYLTAPRFTMPRWLLEGVAVFMETWMGGGLGRAQGGYDEMVFRGMVRDGAPFFDPLSLSTRGVRADFQAGTMAYLYGTRFITWLAWAHSPEKVVAWLQRKEGSRRHYAAAFEQTFGLPLDTAWQQWVAFEQDFQRANLASVARVPITPLQPLTARAVGSSSRLFLDAERQVLYGAFRQTGIVEHIGALNLRDGSIKRLTDIQGGALYSVSSIAYDPAQRKIFYTTRNYNRRDLMVLNVDSGEHTLLIKGGRIGELAFNRADGALIGVRHDRGLASLVRLLPPYTDWQTLYRFAYGVVPSDLDVSPDGQLLAASVSEPQGDQLLRVWSLADLLQPPHRLMRVGESNFGQAAPEGFVFAPDGRTLYGSSYFTGVSNIFRFDLASGRTVAVSNAEVGLFKPLPQDDGQLVVLAYTGEGLLPARLRPEPLRDLGTIRFLGSEAVERHPVLKTWQADSPNTVDDEAIIAARGIYRPLERLGVQSAYPVLQGYKDAVGLGWRVNVGDWLSYANANLTVAVTPDAELPAAERLHLLAQGQYLGWRGTVAWNRSDFYDLFGPTKRSRKGWQFKLGYDFSIIRELPRRLDLRVDVARYTGIDTLPGAQNEAAPFSALSSGELALTYSDLRRSLGAVTEEKGIAADALLALRHAGGQTTLQSQVGLNFGWALPWTHASLWSRTALGASHGERDNPLTHFYFGGFGNNRVDNGAVQRYREPASLPGFGIDAVSGRSFVRQQFELVLPRLLFDTVGTPDLNLTWLRPQLFATALWTDSGAGTRQRHGSAGAQVDLRLGVMHWYEMVLSAGYGAGYTGGRRAGSEWMLSLKIM